MDFGAYLLQTRRITYHEFHVLVAWQNNLREQIPPREFVEQHLDDYKDFSSIRAKPLGPIMECDAKKILQRIGRSVDELVAEWQGWHRDHLEPIATFPLTSKFGPAIYERQLEKKMVARFVVSEPGNNGAPLIHDGDKVVIPAGSSALYVGLAIAAKKHRVQVITSNGCLYREYSDNPAVARSFEKFFLVGGNPDFDGRLQRCEHDGFASDETLELFTQMIQKDPPATVILIPFVGLLPNEGPFDVDVNMGGLKRTLIDQGLLRNVRKVVFIGDYSKHLESSRGEYGPPIYPTPQLWRDLFDRHRDQIAIVTTPPPALRELMLSGELPSVPERKLIGDVRFRTGGVEKEYAQAAKLLDDMSRGNGFHSQFYEAYADPA